MMNEGHQDEEQARREAEAAAGDSPGSEERGAAAQRRYAEAHERAVGDRDDVPAQVQREWGQDAAQKADRVEEGAEEGEPSIEPESGEPR